MGRADFRQCTDDDLAETIGQLHAMEMAVRSTLLEVVAVYDERKAWRADGATSMSAWLAMSLGCSWRTGSELARVARAFSSLPELTAVMAQGSLSWDQACSLAQLATPDTDALWAGDGPTLSAAQLGLLARQHRPPRPDPTRRSLRMRTDADSGWTHLSGRLPGADGAVVANAIERLAQAAPPDADTGRPVPFEARCADALVELASTSLAADADADRACVVVHVDADVLAGAGGNEPGGAGAGPGGAGAEGGSTSDLGAAPDGSTPGAFTTATGSDVGPVAEAGSETSSEAGSGAGADGRSACCSRPAGERTGADEAGNGSGSGPGAVVDGVAIVAEAARRLACDARVEFIAHGPGNVVVGVSRTTRVPPAWLVRQLRRRDGGCRFPGCGRTRWTASHHIVHWANGGPTDMSNLLTLCHFHHVLLHEGGWRVSGNPDRDLCFIRPDGRPLSTGPPPMRPEVAKRLSPLRT